MSIFLHLTQTSPSPQPSNLISQNESPHSAYTRTTGELSTEILRLATTHLPADDVARVKHALKVINLQHASEQAEKHQLRQDLAELKETQAMLAQSHIDFVVDHAASSTHNANQPIFRPPGHATYPFLPPSHVFPGPPPRPSTEPHFNGILELVPDSTRDICGANSGPAAVHYRPPLFTHSKPVCKLCFVGNRMCDGKTTCSSCERTSANCSYEKCYHGVNCRNVDCVRLHPHKVTGFGG